MTQTDQDLERRLAAIDRKPYPLYKQLAGSYEFGGGTLHIERVQSDPFASPSRLSLTVPHSMAGWAAELHDSPWRRRAFEDFLLRRLAQALRARSHKVGGSGKSGALTTNQPGPEVLSRSAVQVDDRGITARLEAGFPAHGRTTDARALATMLLDLIPACADEALIADEKGKARAQAAAGLADDQHALRQQLDALGLVAFVADGSVLPRASGVSSLPMQDAKPFCAPDSLAVEVELPCRGLTRGMGVRKGVTLIVGGGYHGKSTLLKALQEGVYDHVMGDGRELVATTADAVKLRSEDGRVVHPTDISAFIGNLPSGQDTRAFSTPDASGSTSQAAATIEALDEGARLLLFDEDTSATNFMVRDRLMERVVAREHEPITPFVEHVRQLWEREGISSVIVAGSSGAFFEKADTVIQMERYEALDITQRAQALCGLAGEMPAGPVGDAPVGSPACAQQAREGRSEDFPERVPHSCGVTIKGTARRSYRTGRPEQGPGQVKVHTSLDQVEVGDGMADVRLLEQLVDRSQAAAIGELLRHAAQRGILAPSRSAVSIARELLGVVQEDDWQVVFDHEVPCTLALPRLHELAATICRWRCQHSR